MKRIQIYEYVTAEAAKGTILAASLLREGEAMRDAIAADFAAIPGVEVEIVQSIPEQPSADGVLVIAPETDGILLQLAEKTIRNGGRLLGCSLDAIALTSDKWRLFEHFERCQIPTPKTWLNTDCDIPFPRVLKPRDGAGSQDTIVVHSAKQQANWLHSLAPEVRDKLMTQEWIDGQSASISWIIGPKQRIPLVPCEQILSTDGLLKYRGGRILPDPDLQQRAIELSRQAIESIPGLQGYIGIDLVLGEQDTIIEINPRLTSSYIGLRKWYRQNLAGTILQAMNEQTITLELVQSTTDRFALTDTDQSVQ